MRERMRLFLTAASLLSLPVVVMAQQTGTKTGVAGHRDLASWDLNKPEERRRLHLLLRASDLKEVSHRVDWDKLHDEYLSAVIWDEIHGRRKLEEEVSSRRKLKGVRRRKDWNIEKIENDLENKALAALSAAQDFASKEGKKGDGTKKENSSKEETTKGSKHKGGSEGTGATKQTTKGKKTRRPPKATPALVATDAPIAPALPPVASPTAAPVLPPAAAPVLPPAASPADSPSLPTTTSNSDTNASVEEFPYTMVTSKDLKTGGVFDTSLSENHDSGSARQRDEAAFNGIPIEIDRYDRGNCPDGGNVKDPPLPCAPDNLSKLCDKRDPEGSFKACFEACSPSFCCIHDAPPSTNFVAPNCNTDVNCAQYAYCYIVWWKLHDTIGPATQLQLEQPNDPYAAFFDVDAEFIQGDVTNIQFFREMLFHHFDNAEQVIEDGTVVINETLSVFNSDLIFLNESYWNCTDCRR